MPALYQQSIIFVLILTRLSGLIMTAPGFGSGYTPPQVRIFLAVGIALLVSPLHWGMVAPNPAHLVDLATMVTGELVLGVAIGLSILILVSGLQLAGQLISQTGGMQIADLVDPTFDGSVPVFSKLLELVALAVFFALSGHRQLLAAVLHSFQRVPPGSVSWAKDYTSILTEIAGQSFEVGLRASAPVMVAVLLAVLIMGLISRTVPQLNILAVGFSLNALVLLGMLSVSLGAAAWIFHGQATGVLDALREMLGGE